MLEEIEKFREDMNTLKREMSDNTKLINKIVRLGFRNLGHSGE